MANDSYRLRWRCPDGTERERPVGSVQRGLRALRRLALHGLAVRLERRHGDLVAAMAGLTPFHVKPDRETGQAAVAAQLRRRLAAVEPAACRCAPGVWCVPCLAAGLMPRRP